jgi:hypothetical protein
MDTKPGKKLTFACKLQDAYELVEHLHKAKLVEYTCVTTGAAELPRETVIVELRFARAGA